MASCQRWLCGGQVLLTAMAGCELSAKCPEYRDSPLAMICHYTMVLLHWLTGF
jgi:hypothetical protein